MVGRRWGGRQARNIPRLPGPYEKVALKNENVGIKILHQVLRSRASIPMTPGGHIPAPGVIILPTSRIQRSTTAPWPLFLLLPLRLFLLFGRLLFLTLCLIFRPFVSHCTSPLGEYVLTRDTMPLWSNNLLFNITQRIFQSGKITAWLEATHRGFDPQRGKGSTHAHRSVWSVV